MKITSLKDVESYLLKKGYKIEDYEEHVPEMGITIKYKFYISNKFKKCVAISKEGRLENKISIYTNWDDKNKTGEIIYYGLDIKQVVNVVNKGVI